MSFLHIKLSRSKEDRFPEPRIPFCGSRGHFQTLGGLKNHNVLTPQESLLGQEAPWLPEASLTMASNLCPTSILHN